MSASRGCRCSRHNTDSAGRFLKTLVRQPCSVTVVVVQEKKSPHHLVSSTNQMALVHPRLTVKKEAVPSVFFLGPLGARFCFVSGGRSTRVFHLWLCQRVHRRWERSVLVQSGYRGPCVIQTRTFTHIHTHIHTHLYTSKQQTIHSNSLCDCKCKFTP